MTILQDIIKKRKETDPVFKITQIQEDLKKLDHLSDIEKYITALVETLQGKEKFAPMLKLILASNITSKKKTEQLLQEIKVLLETDKEIQDVRIVNQPEPIQFPKIVIPEFPKEIEVKKPNWLSFPDISPIWNGIINIKTSIVEGVRILTSNVFNVKLEAGTPQTKQYVTLVDEEGNAVDLKNKSNAGGVIRVGGGGGTSTRDDNPFTVGTTPVVPSGGLYKSTRDAVDDGDAGAIAMTEKRGVYASIETPQADSVMDDTSDSIKTTSATVATQIDDVTTTSVTYIGKSVIGSAAGSAVWQIMKIDESGTPITTVITWADGNSNYDNVWSNRSSLTYS